MSVAISAAAQSTRLKNGPSDFVTGTTLGEDSGGKAAGVGTDSVGEGVGFFLPLGLIRLPLAMIYGTSKGGRIGKVKRFVDGILLRKQVFLREFRLSKNSHLVQIAIGFLSGHHRSVFQKAYKSSHFS